jgi:pre-mRNA-splicing helicase BRR2
MLPIRFLSLFLLSHAIARSDLAITIPEHWDSISRRWNKRKAVQAIRLYIFDELHLIGYDDGPTLEIVVSRVRYIAQQMQLQWQAEAKGQAVQGKTAPYTRLVCLATSLANAKDIGEWIGASPQSLFNFHPNVRPVPLEVHIQGVQAMAHCSRVEWSGFVLFYSSVDNRRLFFFFFFFFFFKFLF